MEIRDLVRLRKAKDRMDREFEQPLDVPALARSAAMSTGHFSRSFKAAFDESPYSYLMTRRIERAKTLLRRGDMWPVAFALKKVTAAEEARIGTLVKKAVSSGRRPS